MEEKVDEEDWTTYIEDGEAEDTQVENRKKIIFSWMERTSELKKFRTHIESRTK